jgi:hypothetical protein
VGKQREGLGKKKWKRSAIVVFYFLLLFPHSSLTLPLPFSMAFPVVFPGHLFFEKEYGSLTGCNCSGKSAPFGTENVGLAIQLNRFCRLIGYGCAKQGRIV